MKRREFITALGGSAAAWPLAVRAQQPATPVIGFLGSDTADLYTNRLRALREGLKATGWARISQSNIVGRKVVTISYRRWLPTWLVVGSPLDLPQA